MFVLKYVPQVRLGNLNNKLLMRYILTFLFLLLIDQFVISQTIENDWTIFRGKSDLSGSSRFDFPASLRLLWNFPSGERSKSSPVISDDIIYFGTDKGTIYAVSSDGKVKWRFETGSAVEAPPLLYGDKVYAGSSDGVMRAVNKLTGRLVWSYPTDNQIVGSANVWISGKQAGIIFGSYDYFLHCVDPASGKLLWKLETMNYVNGTPAVSKNKIIFGGCDGIIRVADPRTGAERSAFEIGVYIAASPAVINDKAYFGDYDGTFYCLDMFTGKIEWEIAPGETSGSILGIPAVGSNYVIVGNEDKYLYCYKASDGILVWKYRTNGRIVGSPVVTPTKVLFGSMDGHIYMAELTNGKKTWSFNAGAPVSSSPAVVQGRFYFLTEDGRLLAFGVK